jgi:hypothetical protein
LWSVFRYVVRTDEIIVAKIIFENIAEGRMKLEKSHTEIAERRRERFEIASK